MFNINNLARNREEFWSMFSVREMKEFPLCHPQDILRDLDRPYYDRDIPTTTETIDLKISSLMLR